MLELISINRRLTALEKADAINPKDTALLFARTQLYNYLKGRKEELTAKIRLCNQEN